MAKHSGVSNPSLGLSCRVFRCSKVTFVVYFMVAGAFYGLAGIYLYFVGSLKHALRRISINLG